MPSTITFRQDKHIGVSAIDQNHVLSAYGVFDITNFSVDVPNGDVDFVITPTLMSKLQSVFRSDESVEFKISDDKVMIDTSTRHYDELLDAPTTRGSSLAKQVVYDKYGWRLSSVNPDAAYKISKSVLRYHFQPTDYITFEYGVSLNLRVIDNNYKSVYTEPLETMEVDLKSKGSVTVRYSNIDGVFRCVDDNFWLLLAHKAPLTVTISEPGNFDVSYILAPIIERKD